jgi:hypothetical protein
MLFIQHRIAPGTEGGRNRARPGGRGRARSGSQANRVSLSLRVPGLTRDLMPNEAPAQGRGGDVL